MVGNLWNQTSNQNRRGSQKLQWASVKDLMHDPDTAKGERMTRLEELGIDRAAGVPINVDGQAGMVVYMSREKPHAGGMARKSSILDEEDHDTYLKRVGVLLGNMVALTRAKKWLLETSKHLQKIGAKPYCTTYLD